MLGAIIGDIAGSTREFEEDKSYPAELFPEGSHITDDTILTLATAEKLLRQSEGVTYADLYHIYTTQNPGSQYNYGLRFLNWVEESRPGRPAPAYNSLGNGSAMRVSPIGWFFNSLEEVKLEASLSAAPTHNHPEGIRAAEVVASAVFLARTGSTKTEIKDYIENVFDYNLSRDYEEVRSEAVFLETCPESVEEAIIAFLHSESFEDAIYKAIALGGDADTQASIAGSIAEAFYGNQGLMVTVHKYLNSNQMSIVESFYNHIKQQ